MSDGAIPAVRLTAVEKRFGDLVAVHPLDLEIPAGGFFSIIGPSGCGKTTTLRMVAGLEHPDRGTIEVGGRDVTKVPAYRRPVNTVFQSYALFPHLDVHGNIAFGLVEERTPGSEIRRRVAEIVELVHLTGRERSKPGQLSGGQQQRVALARALIKQPQVLLLDEPLGALDLKLRKELQVQLKEVQTSDRRPCSWPTSSAPRTASPGGLRPSRRLGTGWCWSRGSRSAPVAPRGSNRARA